MRLRNILFVFIVSAMASGIASSADPQRSLETLKTKLNKTGAPRLSGTDIVAGKTVPAIYFGKRKLNNNFDVVDEVKKLHGGVATIFVRDGVEFIRVSTNVLKDDGTRAIGTPLARNKAYEAVLKGEMYCGDAEILGRRYETCYDAIKDASNPSTILGVYFVGFKKR